VWLGSQAFNGATAFNANIGAWNTASIANMDYVCALCHRQRVRRVCFMLACVLRSYLEYSHAIGRGRSSLRRCMLLPSASLISRALLCALVRSRKISLGCPHPTATVAVHLDRRAPARTSARSIGPLDAACTMRRPDPSGLMRRGLFEGAWLGSQALRGASAFNANIAAWNTASMTTMASVCALPSPVCVACVLRACLCASLISRELYGH
jgi:hypothetical protein